MNKEAADSSERLHEGFKKHSIIECLYGSSSSQKPLNSSYHHQMLQNYQSLNNFDELDFETLTAE